MRLFALRAALTLGILWALYRLTGCASVPQAEFPWPDYAPAMREAPPDSAWPMPILVKLGPHGGVWYEINEAGTPPLPDSLKAQLRAGDFSRVYNTHLNPGWIVMGHYQGQGFVTLPLDTLDGMWPTPDGWVRWLRVYADGVCYSAYWRQSDSTCVRMWLPHASPSYGEE